ncbi:MAG: TraB/GumN family protein [Erysipelotrichaceae bacterium]|nr:TraB/GumN family protein [Erysipelotrichaceae bacterium]
MDEKNVTRLTYQNKEIILLATAHVSKESVTEVQDLISEELPDSVCIELDQQRFDTINDQQKWQTTDVINVIKEKKAFLLIANMLLGSYQRKIAKDLDVQVGQEMSQAIIEAKKINAKLILADRNIQTTFMRIWRKHTFWEKLKLIYLILFSSMDDEKITAEKIENLKTQDMLEAALSEINDKLPKVAAVLIDERNQYLANKIKNAPGKKIVAVLGAAHVIGITKEIYLEQDMQELAQVPTVKILDQIKGWIIPFVIVSLIAYSFINSPQMGWLQIKSWILYNGTFSAFGCLLLLAHPLTIITAFLVAPITSLNPLLAAGWFAGIVEAMIRKPTVADMQNIYQDITTIKGIFKNRFIKILAIVIVANLFSTLATFISGLDIIERLFS